MCLEFSVQQQKLLLSLARHSITTEFDATDCFDKIKPLQDDLPALAAKDPDLQVHCGCFVTLKKTSNLRGCIGSISANKALYLSVMENACSSAFEDYRFPAVCYAELNEIRIEISILSAFFPVQSLSEIKIGRDGLLLTYGTRRGLFLPQVPLEHDWDLDMFLSKLCLKAGLNETDWKNKAINLERFTASVFSE